jgi:citrate synthase
MQFLKASRNKSPTNIAHDLINTNKKPKDGDWHIAPGFGTRFGSIDIIPAKVAALLCSMPGDWNHLNWANELVNCWNKQNIGWLHTGLAAAAFLDLGFHPRAGAGLFQMASAPGLLAHGLEYANKPRTALPFPDDSHYFVERD